MPRIPPLSRGSAIPLSRRQLLAGGGLLLATPQLLRAAEVSAPSQVQGGHHAHNSLATGAAIDPLGRLWVVGVDGDKRLFVCQARPGSDGGGTEPHILDTGDDEISADGENHPKLAFGPKGWAVISYTQPLDKPYTGMIRMLRSSDGGASFSTPFTVHQDRQVITHRFDSIGFDSTGALHTVWIDKRDQPPKGGGQAYDGAAIYHNVSHDGGASFGPDLKLADHSCECCRIALAPDAGGRLQALWRHVFGGQVRDHAFASLDNLEPDQIIRATEDQWHLNACPHHGPGLARAEGPGAAAYHAVWFGARQQEGHDVLAVRYGRLKSDGSPLPQTVRVLPDPRAEHADVASHGDAVAVVWRRSEGRSSSLRLWLSRDGGEHFDLQTLDQAEGENDHPRLASQGGRLVVVWRLPQEIRRHEIAL